MNKQYLNSIWRGVLLIFIQIFLLKDLEIYGTWINLLLYPLFIFMLPFKTSKFGVIFLSLFYGFIIDIAYDSLGLHASVMLATGYIRSKIIEFLEPQGGYEIQQSPTSYSMGMAWYARYIGFLFLIHYLMYFFLETYNIENGGIKIAFIKTILSSVFSFLIIMIYSLFPNPRS